MRIVDCQQGTDEWLMARLGKVGSSRVADVVARTKSGPSASRANYLAELVAERLTGTPTNAFKSAAMVHGTETEPLARETYQFACDMEVRSVGLVLHPTIENAMASPDGLVNDDGLVEIKCPNTATHIATLLGAEIDGRYVKQMQWQMACTGRQWCDWVSFDPRMPADMQLYLKRVERDDSMIADLEVAVSEFLSEVDATISKLTKLYRQDAAA